MADIRITGWDDAVERWRDTVPVVVEELVANAVRHGGATRIDMSIEVRDGECSISATDDGRSGDEFRPGLGSAVLDRAGTVHRVPGPSGWTVTVVLTG